MQTVDESASLISESACSVTSQRFSVEHVFPGVKRSSFLRPPRLELMWLYKELP